MPLPDAILAVLGQFRFAFTSKTWPKVLVLIAGTLLARGRRTVTAALRATGHGDDPKFPRYHEVLSRAAWSPLRLSRRLLALIVAAFAPGGLTLAIDETLERRWGPMISKRSHHRDPIASSRSQLVVASGLRWIVLAAVVTGPWSDRPWALPFLSVLAPSAKVNARDGRRHRTLTRRARQMIALVRRWLPSTRLTPVGDTTYSAIDLGSACRRRGARLLAPLCKNAALFDEPPPRTPRTRGRPRKVGERLPTPAAIRDDPATAWQAAELAWYDGSTRRLELASGTALWYHSGTGPLPIRWVLTRDPEGEVEPRSYFSTDPADSAEAVVADFLKRWPIETTFEESRAHLGIETQRRWSDLAIERETPCLFGLYSVVALLTLALHPDGEMPIRATAWYRKTRATFADCLASVRRSCWELEDFRDPGGDPRVARIPRPLLDLLRNAVLYAH
jgi:DDE superfamily endonuclease